jgi:hypothetical protein
VFADEFFDHARDGFFDTHHDRSAYLALLGDVMGNRALYRSAPLRDTLVGLGS